LESKLTFFLRPYIIEAAVVGLPSEQWGQKVAAIVVLDPEKSQGIGRGGKPWGIMDMRRALKDQLAAYKIPQELRILKGSIPRNAMGKGRSLCIVELAWID
jgi:acyl-CoA synthetase (AMP-forming)/AMP-acid ligase II